MSGNLQSVASMFVSNKLPDYELASNIVKPKNVIDLSQIEDEVPFDVDWRNGRKSHDALPELEKLSNPVGLHETLLWNWKDIEDVDLEELPDPMPPTQTNNNFEDYADHCDQISSVSTKPLSRVSNFTKCNLL